MPNPDKLIASVMNLGFAALALIIAGDLVQQILVHLTPAGLMAAFVGLVLMSPVAYFLLRAEMPQSEHRPRRGAERTPLLPPNNEGEQ